MTGDDLARESTRAEVWAERPGGAVPAAHITDGGHGSGMAGGGRSAMPGARCQRRAAARSRSFCCTALSEPKSRTAW